MSFEVLQMIGNFGRTNVVIPGASKCSSVSRMEDFIKTSFGSKRPDRKAESLRITIQCLKNKILRMAPLDMVTERSLNS